MKANIALSGITKIAVLDTFGMNLKIVRHQLGLKELKLNGKSKSIRLIRPI